MDVIATCVIYSLSVVIKNTSLYDPYWSFTPWVMATYLMFYFKSSNIYVFILYVVFSLWSIRLTINWMITFKGLEHEDWRYDKYRHENNKVMFEIINFFGLQMMPTLLVYATSLPLFMMIEKGASFLSIVGSVVVFEGFLLELFSDHQMHKHIKENNRYLTCRTGLWQYCRHPNYLGENLVWIGVALAYFFSFPRTFYFSLGFILMILLFEFISIPLMEKRQLSRRKDYQDYIDKTGRMFFFKKK